MANSQVLPPWETPRAPLFMGTPDFETMVKLGRDIAARYLGQMMVRDGVTGESRPLTNLEMHAGQCYHDEQKLLAEREMQRRGCCGHQDGQYIVHYEDHVEGQLIARRSVIKCHITGRECPQAQLSSVIERWAAVNSQASFFGSLVSRFIER